MIVHFDALAEQIMTNHAVQAYPTACSGYLFGTLDADGKKIYGALAIDPAKPGMAIESDNTLQQNAEEYAMERKWQLLGMYHSCPDSPAFPDSHTNNNESLLTNSQVLISVSDANLKDIRSWVMKSCGRYAEEMILAFRQIHTS